MAQRALPLDDDHIRVFALERLENGSFHLTGAELRRDGIESNAVAGALNQSGLAGADHHRFHTAIVEGTCQNRGGRALADGAVGTEHGDARACDLVDATAEHPQVLLGAGLANVEDHHIIRNARGCELPIVIEKLMEAVHDVHSATYRVEHQTTLMRR